MTKEQFIGQYNHWDSYKPLLWEALENTCGVVLELGVGFGSTEKLHSYCAANQRQLFSYESDLEYYKQFERFRSENHAIEYVGANWEIMIERHRDPIGVLFSDEAPGEMRKFNVSMFCNLAQVIVCHDTELTNDNGYKFSLVAPLFKYVKRFESPGADATAFSNFIDVSKWKI